jgi:hypothetical protein
MKSNALHAGRYDHSSRHVQSGGPTGTLRRWTCRAMAMSALCMANLGSLPPPTEINSAPSRVCESTHHCWTAWK